MHRTLDLLCALALVPLLCCAGSAAQGVKYTSSTGNINGQLLVLDVTSLSFQGNHPMFPAYGRPTDCEKACKNMPECSAWTFCNSTSGCGSGCIDYVNKNPPLKWSQNGNPTIRNPGWKLPLTGFGPWGPTGNCRSNWSAPANRQQLDVWPQGMCSLKVVADPAKPMYWSRNAKEGWVSGTIQLPPNCKGVSAAVCEGCAGTKDPAACMACAKSPGVQPANPVDAVGANVFFGASCVKCYNSSANPAKCADCILKGQACKKCPLDTWPSGDVDACIACANKWGSSDAAYGPCVTCSTMSNAIPAAVQRCMACTEAARKIACPSPTSAYDRNYTCADLWSAAGECATCSTYAADFGACSKCIVTKPFASGCASCASLKGASEQAACYKCRATTGVTSSVCSDCSLYTRDPEQKKFCMGCLADRTIGPAGKSWCFGCSNWAENATSRAKCQKCLATPQSNYVDACGRN